MMFAAAVGHRSGRATPSLRDAPQRQSMETTGRGPSIGTETLFRQTRPLHSCATSPRPVKGSSPKGGNHDADCSPHRSVPQ